MTTTATEEQADRLARLAANRARSGASKWKSKTHWWLRWVHVYLSMISLLIVVFFGVTGITLNHPDWTFGSEPTRSSTNGTLPDEAFNGPEVEWLTVSEHLRNAHGARGAVTDFASDDVEGTISFKGPGYGAEVFFDMATGEFTLTEDKQGWVTIVNDLHKGRDTNSSWRWLIDVSGAFLVLVGLSGLGIQLFMRKRRVSALTWALIGGALGLGLIWYALR